MGWWSCSVSLLWLWLQNLYMCWIQKSILFYVKIKLKGIFVSRMAGCEGYIALPKSLLLIRHPLLLVSPPAVERGNLLSWRRPRNHSTRGSGWHSSMVGMSPGRQCWAPVYDSEMGKNLAELDFEHKNDLLGWLGPYRSWILCWTMANAPLSLRWGGQEW
jgi:hypothetical protein